jgi:hypothetical protein
MSVDLRYGSGQKDCADVQGCVQRYEASCAKGRNIGNFFVMKVSRNLLIRLPFWVSGTRPYPSLVQGYRKVQHVNDQVMVTYINTRLSEHEPGGSMHQSDSDACLVQRVVGGCLHPNKLISLPHS